MTTLPLLLPWSASHGAANARATATAAAERAPWLAPRPVEVRPAGAGPEALAFAGLAVADAGPALVWSGTIALDPCHLHAELLLWRTGPAALAAPAARDLPWAVLARQLALPTGEEDQPPWHDLSLIWAPDAATLAALWSDTVSRISPLLGSHDSAAVLTAAFGLSLQRLAPQRRPDHAMGQLPPGLCPGLAPADSPPPMALSQAIWQSDDPHQALLALAHAGLADGTPATLPTLSQAVEAAAMVRDPQLISALWSRLDQLDPSPWLWGLRLRLWLASDASLPWPTWAGDEPLALPAQLPEANRLLLAQALQAGRLRHPGLLSAVLNELPKQQRLLHRLRLRNNAAGALAALVPQLSQLDADRQGAVRHCYATARPSLRHPAFAWFSAEAADRSQLEALVQQIGTAVDQRRGFCLMRLGDGEALLLDGRRPCLGGATSNGAISTDRLTADGLLQPEEHERLVQRFLQAVEAASVVGIPDLGQCLNGPEHYGLVAATLVRALPPDRFNALAPQLLPGGSHLHLFLLACGAFSRPPFLEVHGVIGPVLPAGLAGRSCWQPIPGEKGKHPVAQGAAHYPLIYEETLAWIDREARPGRLFLVGAGLLGKIYCAAIQQRGGVAVDVGSVLDLCGGSGATRGESRLQPFLLQRAERAFGQTS